MNDSEQPREQGIPAGQPVLNPRPVNVLSAPLSWQTLKQFFNLTGGSILYCLSAVFVAYGIVRILGPVLSGGELWLDAFPCLATLHLYELALLGAMVLIVSRRVVDDAISLAVLIALYLVGTSIAQGSVADLNIRAALWAAVAGLMLAGGKFFLMRRFAGIPLRILSMLGLLVAVGGNYLGPVLLARSVLVNPTQEAARRQLWWAVGLVMLIGAALVWIESLRRPISDDRQGRAAALLRQPAMVLIFTLLILACSGVHQYTMAYAFALERTAGDYVPVLAVSCLLLMEILRRMQFKIPFLWIGEALIACVPLGAMLLAIDAKEVTADWGLSFGVIAYPPVLFAIFGLAAAALALVHQRLSLLLVAVLYGFGVILAFGFSPEHPYALNYHACIQTLALFLLLGGLIVRMPYVCVAGVFLICVDMAMCRCYIHFAAAQHLSMAGFLAGVFGGGCVLLALLFGKRLHGAIRAVSVLCLAAFVYDYLPNVIHWRYLIAFAAAGVITWALWRRMRNLFGSVLGGPFLVRLFFVLKQLAFWRFIILGFLLLAGGTILSLFKRPPEAGNQPAEESHEE